MIWQKMLKFKNLVLTFPKRVVIRGGGQEFYCLEQLSSIFLIGLLIKGGGRNNKMHKCVLSNEDNFLTP